mmetsp:Transcript_5960/g.14509  ORF Transcript_5960/g.14509 Transcript_5960/m.14509 type:complete len:243 (-) Transcript_5960:323-1051(-)
MKISVPPSTSKCRSDVIAVSGSVCSSLTRTARLINWIVISVRDATKISSAALCGSGKTTSIQAGTEARSRRMTTGITPGFEKRTETPDSSPGIEEAWSQMSSFFETFILGRMSSSFLSISKCAWLANFVLISRSKKSMTTEIFARTGRWSDPSSPKPHPTRSTATLRSILNSASSCLSGRTHHSTRSHHAGFLGVASSPSFCLSAASVCDRLRSHISEATSKVCAAAAARSSRWRVGGARQM